MFKWEFLSIYMQIYCIKINSVKYDKKLSITPLEFLCETALQAIKLKVISCLRGNTNTMHRRNFILRQNTNDSKFA